MNLAYSPPPDSTVYGYKDITFTGAAGAGAVGAVTILTCTGTVDLSSLIVECITDLVNAVDGATFGIGVTGLTNQFFNSTMEPLDLDAIDAGDFLYTAESAVANIGTNLIFTGTINSAPIASNVILTVATQAITGGVLRFYYAYRPLSAGATLT